MHILEENVKLSVAEMGMLDSCALIEIKCAELYRQFELAHWHDSELAALWRKTALEEDNHAEQFRIACRLKGAEMAMIKHDMSRIEVILRTLDTYLERIQHTQPTPLEGLEFAIKLEEVLSEYHMSNVVEFADNGLAKLFSSMMDNDVGHVTHLKNARASILQRMRFDSERFS